MADKLINTSDLVEKSLENLDKSSGSGLSPQDQPQSDVVDRFENLVSGKVEATPEEKVAANQTTEVTEAQPQALTLGDKILQGMQGIRDQVEMKSEAVKMSMAPGEAMNMREMFQTQMAMTNLMVTEDYIGKIVSKSTQTFDTLLRNQ